jgi:hypothetical protein
MSDVVQSVRQLLQDFIAPELRDLKSDLKQVDAKIDSESSSLKAKIDSETKRLEDKIVSEVGRLEGKMDSGCAQMRTLLEMPACAPNWKTRAISDLHQRVTRLEVERGAPRQ